MAYQQAAGDDGATGGGRAVAGGGRTAKDNAATGNGQVADGGLLVGAGGVTRGVTRGDVGRVIAGGADDATGGGRGVLHDDSFRDDGLVGVADDDAVIEVGQSIVGGG